MSEPAPVELPYAQIVSDAARESRRGLSIEVQAALLDIQDDIAREPKGFPPSQLKALNLAKTTFLYKHPELRVEVTFELLEERRIVHFMHYAQVMVELRKKVFVSYAHEDAGVLAELKGWLGPLETEKLIELWDDNQIRAGDEWLKVIEGELSRARMALLLVSDSFAASSFIRERELPTILELVEAKGVRLLWVAVSYAPIESLDIAKYQSVNDPEAPLEDFEGSARKKQLRKIYKKIEEVVRS